MATKLLLHYPNLVDTATLTPSSEDANFPVENVQNEQRSIVFKTAAAVTDFNIVIDNAVNTYASEFLIVNHNIPNGATITIDRNTSLSWPANTVTITWGTLGNVPVVFRWASNNMRYTRLRIQCTSTILNIGRLIMCVAKTPAINYSWGYTKRRLDMSEPTLSLGGQIYTNVKSKITEYDFEFYTKAADIAILEAFFNAVGIGKHCAMSFDYDANPYTETYYGFITEQLEYVSNAPNAFEVSTLTFREAT